VTAKEDPDVAEVKEAEMEYQTTESGLKYRIIEYGRGIQAEKGDIVRVHYSGKLTDGTIFDNSYERGEPIKFQLGIGRVILGWDEGIALLHQGDKAEFIIPPDLGYGDRDLGTIPPNSTLIFEVELVEVISEQKPAEGK
ncbi:MAG: FKBP-type peptidyl-prolyl cis-trans isomerase, partial [Candidatus Cloacimonetes bacterium]|nr:FKBP-type peptidyl-prolyl cis-trans isomerase [Candidatus Cloacimonadota bacterium]